MPIHPLAHFHGKAVCVTGAGGSIGSEICRRLLELRVKRLTLISLTEAGLYNIERELRPQANQQDCELIPLLGSVTNSGLVREALQDIDIVIHAAAHKHVPICEQNPLSAIENNVLGAYVLLGEAALAGVKQFILISSDKAVKPASVMGATKRIAELIVRDIPDADSAMRRTVVRFGNVLDSAGSVLPLWREQIAKGGPLTLTDERCTRYFMSIPEAVDLVLNTTALNSSGTFVLDMGSPRKMIDLALDLLEKAHENRFRTREECRDGIRFIGLRPGEKLTEELNYGGELLPTKLDRVRRVRESIDHVLGWGALKVLIDAVITRHTELALKTMWDLVA